MISPGSYCQNWTELQDTYLVSENCLVCGKSTHLVSEVKCVRNMRINEKHRSVFFQLRRKNYITLLVRLWSYINYLIAEDSAKRVEEAKSIAEAKLLKAMNSKKHSVNLPQWPVSPWQGWGLGGLIGVFHHNFHASLIITILLSCCVILSILRNYLEFLSESLWKSSLKDSEKKWWMLSYLPSCGYFT